ncbi:MAG: PIN domain-containing protein [Chloroflexi bacterium]|nr:PIN domain-containing protein [Chloroflexota bacterium]
MSQVSLERALPNGHRILVDSSTLIAYFNRGELVWPAAAHIVDQLVWSGRNPAIVSMVTAMEVLVRPLLHGPGEPYQHVIDFLGRFPNIRAVPIDLPVAQEAASLRATYRFSAPDALVIATGIVHQVSCLVTNDGNWPTKLHPVAGRIRVCYLTNHLPFP